MGKMNHIIFCVIGLSVILYGSAQNLTVNEGESNQDRIHSRDQRKAVTDFERKTWNVATNLYKGANKPELENLIFSPISLTTAMAMLNSGAGGETAREIQTLFKFGNNSELTIRDQTVVLNSLKNQTLGKKSGVKLLTASRIYANSQKAQLLANYVTAVSSLGEVETLDFTDPKPVVAEINNWVKGQTQGKISKIVEEDNFSGETAVVLLDTLYFKAPWKQPFNKSDTEKNQDFYVTENNKVKVEMMHIEEKFPYVDLEEIQASAVFLPYKGDRFSMIIYLPYVGRNLATLEGKLETLVPSQVRKNATATTISLHLPKFNISSSLDFQQILTSLGVRKMFKSSEADFSPMSDSPLFVSKIQQKVVIEVNEEGSEAAAVTAVELASVSAPNVVRVDRPFIFQIYDSVTGTILFSGRISNPNPRQNEAKNNNQVRTTTRTTAAPKVSTTVSPEAALEDRIMAKLTETLDVRGRILNLTISEMQSQMSRMAAAFRSKSPGSSTVFSLNKKVQAILEAFKNGRNALVKSLLDDLTNDQQLDKSMPEIVRGMFDGNFNNYPKIISLLKSAKRGQFKSGLTSLIDLFNNTVGTSSSNSNSNSGTQFSSSGVFSFMDEPEYLHLAYLAKTAFGSELQSKFTKTVQNLVFSEKVCLRNLLTNNFLSVDNDEGLKDGGYSVSTRKTSPELTTAALCDWEIAPRNGSASFIIRQKSQAETLNLNVLEGSVFAGNDGQNRAYFWKIQFMKNAQEMTLQHVAASLKNPSYFLCSAKALNKAERAAPRRGLELLESEDKPCKWTIDSPQ